MPKAGQNLGASEVHAWVATSDIDIAFTLNVTAGPVAAIFSNGSEAPAVIVPKRHPPVAAPAKARATGSYP